MILGITWFESFLCSPGDDFREMFGVILEVLLSPGVMLIPCTGQVVTTVT